MSFRVGKKRPHATRRWSVIVLVAACSLLLWGRARSQEHIQPVYVGARVCGSCHEGPGMGHQFSKWLLSKHSRAYASLAKPEAKEIARLSGIPLEPSESSMCLGCHATAADAEAWEKDPTFLITDGVQCERCHGPGSEYMDEGVMRDREAAMKAGLRMPSKRECRSCHYEKGSHVAIHSLPQLDVDEGWERLAHSTPKDSEAGAPPVAAVAPRPAGDGPRYVGVAVCAECHAGPRTGYQFSLWRWSAHAQAYAELATPAAARIAREEGVEGDPQQEPRCLSCHVTGAKGEGAGFLESYSVADGVGCESCHGAGSDYVAEAIMLDPRAARAAGLAPAAAETCMPCHEAAHGATFDTDAALAEIAHPTVSSLRESAGPRYKTPVNLAATPDGREVYVACEASDTVVVVDAREWKKRAEIQVGRQPNDVAFSPDGRTAYVSTRLDDSVSVIDVASRSVRATVEVGDEPHGLLTDATGRRLFVLNTAADSVSVIDTESFEEIKRLATSRNPWSISLSPDGTRILVTNNLSRFVEARTPLMSEVTVLDTERAVVDDRVVLPETNLLQGVSWHPEGEFALVTINRTKNLVPMTRIVQGWTITNGLGIVWSDGRSDQVLLDEPNLCFPDAADVAVTPDGRHALVTSSGSDRVAVVDVTRLIAMLDEATPREREEVFPNHLGKSTEFVIRHVPTEASPRGILVDRDGKHAFVANALDDSLTVIDLERFEAVRRIDLGGPSEISQVRRGERLFHSADIAFQRQFSCHSCHPDGHVDGITYDIEPDGIGLNPVDNRSLRGILDTAPFKWTGKNPTLQRQCGPRLAVFFTRLEPFTPDELDALESYIRTIPRPPNRHRPLGAPLTPAQRRGKRLFERAFTNGGRLIAERDRCVTCHFPPLYTDRTIRDVGTKLPFDTHSKFDVPHLTNIYDSAPYLHNGAAATLEEIWTKFNPKDKHGVTNDLTKDQLNDLIEFLKTL
jgi:YVTN family beta-propeller protein